MEGFRPDGSSSLQPNGACRFDACARCGWHHLGIIISTGFAQSDCSQETYSWRKELEGFVDRDRDVTENVSRRYPTIIFTHIPAKIRVSMGIGSLLESKPLERGCGAGKILRVVT